MPFSSSRVPPASSIFAAYASISTFIMMIQTMLNQFVSRELQYYVIDTIYYYFKPKPNNATIVIEEKDGISSNELYDAAEIYLCTKIKPNIERLKISKGHKDNNVSIKFAQSEKIEDSFEGIDLKWWFVSENYRKYTSRGRFHDEDTDHNTSDKRYFQLSFDKNFKDLVLDSYIPFMLEKAKSIKAENKVLKLHTLAATPKYSDVVAWDSINLQHPSTFDTLAMEPRQKKTIVEDLDRFVRRKDFYKKVGRAWKRGYLLYGPPGTGKSSLIAAMANYLKFDIYDLELTSVKKDSDLKKLLLMTENRSILVIEDIDCSAELPDRNGSKKKNAMLKSNAYGYYDHPRDKEITLSGLLNFIDGLWSSCGDERIIIFTTNHKEKLDPALLRPGRMDMHIHMSYLTPDGFKLLASTYLGIQDQNPRFSEIEDLIRGMNVTPAEVAEELMQSDDADTCLEGLLNFLKCKKNTENNSLKDKVNDEVQKGDEGIMTDDSDSEHEQY